MAIDDIGIGGPRHTGVIILVQCGWRPGRTAERRNVH